MADEPSLTWILETLAASWKGRLEPGAESQPPSLVVPHGPWSLVLSLHPKGTEMQGTTELRARYVSRTGLRFEIYREDWLSRLAEFLGAQDVHVGDALFDEAYRIKASDPAMVTALLTPDIRLRLLSQNVMGLRAHHPAGGIFSQERPDVDELFFGTGSLIVELDLLEQLLGLFSAVLDQLALMGVADPRAVDPKLP